MLKLVFTEMNSFVLGEPRLYWLRISGGLEDVASVLPVIWRMWNAGRKT